MISNVMRGLTAAAGIPNSQERAFLESYWRSLGWGTRANHPFNSGVWDDNARRNLAETQRRLGVAATGRWDGQTLSAIERTLAGVARANPMASGAIVAAQYGTAQYGNYGTSGNSVGYAGSPGVGRMDAAPGFAPPRSEEEIRAFIHSNYGHMAMFMNHPELGPILWNAAVNGHDAGLLQGAIWNTQWWQTKSANERDWEMLSNEDPASARRRVEQRNTELRDTAMQIGLKLLPQQIYQMAEDSLRYGWNDAELRDMLATHINIFTSWNTGLVKTIFDQARNLGGEYFIETTDDQALQFAIDVVRGDYQQEDIAGWFRAQAKSKYAHLGNVLDQGVTMRQYFDPHRAQLADLLEVSADSIDFVKDKRWQEVITRIDPDSGMARAMTIGETADLARSQDAWRKTKNSRQSAAQMGTYLMEQFGQVML
jgi:hypothetical protein